MIEVSENRNDHDGGSGDHRAISCIRQYVILDTCNPPLAHQALAAELEIGLLLPCNVIVYEDDGGSVVSIADPIAMLAVANAPELVSVAREARARLERVIAVLRGAGPSNVLRRYSAWGLATGPRSVYARINASADVRSTTDHDHT